MKNKRKKLGFYIFVASITLIFSGTFAFLYNQITSNKQLVINSGVLDLVLEEENAITISDALPMYDEVGMIQEDAFVFRLVNKTANDTNYILKLQEIETGTLDKSIVKYGLIKEGERTIDFVSNIVDGIIDEGIIKGTDTIDYEFRLWIDSSVTEMTQVQNKFLSFKMTADAKQEIPKDPSSAEVKLFASENLGSNCKTYDDGVDKFLVGQCSQNYVWYSGKLWRVVLKNNETGAVKMITDNAMTSIPYNASGKTMFENSYADQWLQQEFLPTLHDYEDYLVTDSIWDATENSSSTPDRPAYTTQVTRTVGLLNSYEYYTTTGDYLNQSGFWWLITPSDDYNMLMIYYGKPSPYSSTNAYGIRPVVNLKSSIKVVSGLGTHTNPYILEGDLDEPVNGTTLLNTRYSGEYIIFNNELYRIIGAENHLTKITAVSKPDKLSSVVYDIDGIVDFSESDIKISLENYYQTLDLNVRKMIKENSMWYLGYVGQGTNYKAAMCATVVENVSMNDCIERTTSTTANIGLPRAGEMFTCQITRGARTYFLTLTPYSNTYILHITNNSTLITFKTSDTNGARPSMYLKQNVVISKDNTGNGTYEHPYSIELGS